MEELVAKIAEQIKTKIGDLNPEIAIILGSGLSEICDNFEQKIIIPYDEIDGMLHTTVVGHKNQFIVGRMYGKAIIIMQGRFHLYDGFSAKQVCMPIYVFKKLGVKTLIETNASGGINNNLSAGDIMLLTDQINITGQNALIGGAITNFGEEFIDMTEPYDIEYRNIMLNVAKDNDIKLKQGTYIQFTGPFYETKAEIKMASVIGADAVGMSTAIEVEAARQCQIKVVGLSAITNMASGLNETGLSHSEVLEGGKEASNKMITLIDKFIKSV